MTLAILIIVPLVICGLLYFYQDQMIFRQAPLSEARRNTVNKQWPAAEITLTMTDQTRLHGWYVKPRSSAEPPFPLIIYFGGNAEEVSHLLSDVSRLPNHAFLLLNYRGYGLSEGMPSEEKLFEDALEVYDQFAARPEVDRYYILAMGRSLGSGVAVHLAAKRQLRGVVLISPYDSVLNVAQQSWPWLPISLLLKHRFDSLAKAPKIETPLLAIMATRDRVVPIAHSRRLSDNWGGVVYQTELSGVGHNDISSHPRYWPVVRAFSDMMTTSEATDNAGHL